MTRDDKTTDKQIRWHYEFATTLIIERVLELTIFFCEWSYAWLGSI